MAIQWRRILADALERAEAVAVGEVVRSHLEREPTRSEITAARRAANRYADDGYAVALHVRTRSGARERDRQVLVLARPDAGPEHSEIVSDIAYGQQSTLQAPAQPHADEAIAKMLTKTARAASRTARQLNVDAISPRAARVFEVDIGEAMRELERLKGKLSRRGMER